MKTKLKILLFDIETMPNLVRTWGKWQQDVIWYVRHSYTWSISYKYLGEKKVYHKNITDFPMYKKDKFNDKELVKFIWNLMDDADIVIAHNGNAFDTKYVTGRFAHFRLGSPSVYQKIDTKFLFKKYLHEDSNSLKDIAIKHGLTHKLETGGYKLWEDCEFGDKKAIRLMKEYNNGDVVTLEEAYLFIRPFIDNHPNLALMTGEIKACPNCLSKNIIKKGFGYSSAKIYQRYLCKECGARPKSALKDNSQIR